MWAWADREPKDEEDYPPKIRFGTVKASDPLDSESAFNTKWVSPFICGVIFGFGIGLIIFEIVFQ